MTERPKPAIVLVRPQLAQNIGAAARAMANCGLSDLRLVAPRDGWPNQDAIPMASGATAILDAARVFEDLPAAIADLGRTWATSARPRDLVKRIATARGAAVAMREAVAVGARVGVVFGPERTGLDTDEVVACHELLEIPLDPAFSSLNLAQAVLVVAYEWFQAGDETPPQRIAEGGRGPASTEHIHAFLRHLEDQLVAAGFLGNPLTRGATVRVLRNFVMRADPTDQDIRALHGVLTALSGKRWHQLKGSRPDPSAEGEDGSADDGATNPAEAGASARQITRALLNAAAFLELSSDEVLDPDSAVGALEQIAFDLALLDAEGARLIGEVGRQMAVEERASGGAAEARAEFLGGFPAALGLRGAED